MIKRRVKIFRLEKKENKTVGHGNIKKKDNPSYDENSHMMVIIIKSMKVMMIKSFIQLFHKKYT